MRKGRMSSLQIRRLTYAALYLAIAMVLPFITGQIPEIGSALCPMHIPALLCGFMCGAPWGLAVGFIAPLLRSVVFGMPTLFPGAVAMAFELAVYGGMAGFLRQKLPRGVPGSAVRSCVSVHVRSPSASCEALRNKHNLKRRSSCTNAPRQFPEK